MTDTIETSDLWLAKWFEAVEENGFATSQRTRSWIDLNGGLPAVVAAAKARGIHLAELTGDGGQLFVVASRCRFEALC